MKTELDQFSALVGIDWADKKHDVCVQAAGSEQRQFSQVLHTVEAIDQWARAMHRAHGGPIAIAIELSKGPIVSALQKFDFFVIYPINPSTLAKYREAFKPSRAKDDPTDAEMALDLLLHHPDRFQPLRPQSVEMRTLAVLVEQRRRLMDERVRITNRLRHALKQYYPQVLEWFDRIDTSLFCAFIRKWPTVEQARRARQGTLETFFHQHNLHRKAVLDRRIAAIRSAVALTVDPAVIVPYRLQTLTLIDQLELSLGAIDTYGNEIADLAQQHPDYKLFSCLPGAGPFLAPRLLVAFGEQRDRFASAAEVQKYAGVAPVTERSGQKTWVHWRWQCPAFLRQTFVEWGCTDDQQVLLGWVVLLPATRQRLLLPDGRQGASVQMDPHLVSLLDLSLIHI